MSLNVVPFLSQIKTGITGQQAALNNMRLIARLYASSDSTIFMDVSPLFFELREAIAIIKISTGKHNIIPENI